MQGVFNPNILIYHPPNSTEGLHFSAVHYFNVVSSFSYFQTLPNILDYEINIKIVIFIIIIISQFTCYALYTIILKSEKSFIITIMNY